MIGKKFHSTTPLYCMACFLKFVENRGTTVLLFPLRLYGPPLLVTKFLIKQGVLSLAMLQKNFTRLNLYIPYTESRRGTQRPNVFKYARSVSNGFPCALETCLVNLEFCPKNYLSVRMSLGNFGCHESLWWLFRLIRKCQLPFGSGRKFEEMKQPCFHQKIIGDILSLYRILRRRFLTIIIQPPKIVVKLLENLRIFKTNETVIQKFLASLKLQKFLQAIFAPSSSYFTEKIRWVPLESHCVTSMTVFDGVSQGKLKLSFQLCSATLCRDLMWSQLLQFP